MARHRKAKPSNDDAADTGKEKEPDEQEQPPDPGSVPESSQAADEMETDQLVGEDGEDMDEDIVVPPAMPSVATYDPCGPRLMITHIENINFKSYAGTQVLGPFHKCFTCIVGPNGSGKSNVIDSMLFVFGYRANKIRLKKIGMLIHNSGRHGNIDSCSVSVYFQKIVDGAGDAYDVVPGSRFVVSRTAHRDNTSFYAIDGRRVKFAEVGRLLRGSAIDLDHNRFLILQGEVEQIALMKPRAVGEHDEGMLEFLEDIVGSARFKEPIEKLAARVERLNEVRGEKLNRVKAVEREKDELCAPRDEAVAFLRLENDVARAKNRLYHKYVDEARANLDRAETARGDVRGDVDSAAARLAEVNGGREKAAARLRSVEEEEAAAAARVDACDEEFKEYDRRDTKNLEDIKHAKSKGKKLAAALESEHVRLAELQGAPAARAAEIAELAETRETREQELAAAETSLEAAMASLKGETQSLQDDKDVKEARLLQLQPAINDAKSHMDVAQSELDLCLSNQQKAQARLDADRANLEKVVATIAERKTQTRDLEERIPAAERELETCERELTRVDGEEAALTATLRTETARERECRAALAASRNTSAVLDALMREQRRGALPGVVGRLGDLGGIDARYDVAISSACAALGNIVVDTIETAQACVSFLKRNNVGYATFIALDKMQHWRRTMDTAPPAPEGAPRLFDLVRARDDSVRPAFYFALRDTLVADNLAAAGRIAYGGARRRRVVTLDGAVIETSGTMAGGGKQVRRGGMGRTAQGGGDPDSTPERLREMEEKLERDREEVRRLRERKLQLEDRARELRRDIERMRRELEKHRYETAARADNEAALRRQVRDAERAVAAAMPDDAAVDALRATLADRRAVHDAADARAAEVKAEVAALRSEIMKITASRTKKPQRAVDAATAAIGDIDGSVTKAKVAITTANRNIKKSGDRIKSTETEIEENKAHYDKLVELKAEVESSAETCVKEKGEAATKRAAAGETARELRAALKELDDDCLQMEKDAVHARDQLETYEHQVKESRAQVRHWQRNIASLSLTAIEAEPDDAGAEKQEEEPLPAEFTREELDAMDRDDMQHALTVQEELLQRMSPNMAAIGEYARKRDAYLRRVGELDGITRSRDARRRLHEDLRRRRLDEFMAGFAAITSRLREMYQMITLGGDAELELVDTLDPFAEGIVFSVRPPKKSWKNIGNLSGGEKTLSSLALVFALHHYRPTPLYVMDEIDAALDFRNVSIVGNYIKERTKNAQFLVISLRNNMFELADRLVGIYKTHDATKSVTINPTAMRDGDALQERVSDNVVPAGDEEAVAVGDEEAVAAEMGGSGDATSAVLAAVV